MATRAMYLVDHHGDGAAVAGAAAGSQMRASPLDAPWDEVAGNFSDTGAKGPAMGISE